MLFLRKKGKPEDVSTGVQRSNTMPSPRSRRPQQDPQSAPQPNSSPRGPNFRPVVLSIRDHEWVHQRMLLIYGRAGPDIPFEGQIIVDHHNNSFPPQSFPVTDSHYKALAHLIPGPNNLRLTFIPPPEISRSRFTTRFTVHYLPLLQNPPLHLAIVLARDSDGTFEAPIDRATGLEEAVKRLRVASLLWQAYTAEQLYRNFPPPPSHSESARRSFRLEEEWMEDTLSLQETDVYRSSTKIHIVRSALTVDEIRLEASIARGKGVKAIVRDALELYGSPFNIGDSYAGPTPTVLCLLLDPYWRELMGRDRVNPTDSKLQLGVFISRTLWSWPGTIEEVIPSLQDDTQFTPTSPGTGQRGYSSYGSPFEAASAGLGGMLRELGYAFGCAPEEAGSTIRNLQTFHRTFLTQEGQISRSQLQGLRPCLPPHESSWHRLDCVQFRYRQCFRLPAEPPVAPDEVIFWPCENGIIVTAPSGIILILVRISGKTFPVGWFEYPDRPEYEVFLFESDIINRIPEDQRIPGQALYLEAISAGGGRVKMHWQTIMKEGRSHISEYSAEIFESRIVGKGQTEGSENVGYFIFNSPLLTSGLINLRISHARALYSIEFQYADGMILAFGKPHPESKQTNVPLDPFAGEMITGFAVRAGKWVDAIKVITNKKESAWLGDDRNTSTFQLKPPQGYEIIGICGQIGTCCDAFGVVYTSNT